MKIKGIGLWGTMSLHVPRERGKDGKDGACHCNFACFQIKFKRVKEVSGAASLPQILVYLGDGAFAWRGSVWRESLWSKTKASAGLGWTYRYCW